MKVGGRTVTRAAGLALTLLLAAAAPAAAVPDRTLNVTTANNASNPAKWDGTAHDGLNQDYDSATGVACDKTAEHYCDDTLLNVSLPAGITGGVQVDISDYRPDPTADFDLYVYESDATGKAIKLVPNDSTVAVVFNGNGLPNALPETFAFAAKAGYYLVRVVYYQAPLPLEQYSGTVQVNDRVLRTGTAPDVDAPAGLQDYLASNPALKIRSHSEPHIAQSPIDPDILVAGSKQYNPDRDSLAEYEFKIGTYVSFDRGVTWTDLGQLQVCPLAESPQSSWPSQNTCYPKEDPDKGGTGAEDVKENDADTAFDDRGSGDLAEEYITSDVWIQFDDEGSAYVMVLDSPPFPISDPDPAGLGLTEGNGWGMTMHKWDSVSPDDLRTGKTWGPRVPINFYADQIRERTFLDDKNTMAVNNAGPDRDGKPGTILTCWGRSITTPPKQEIVCERSTDGGKSFPGEPIPVSEPHNLVIGVDVVADPNDENTFHLIWNWYFAVPSPYNQMYYAKTTDGGQTWTPPVPLGPPFQALPRTYPGQNFRQLSIPIMAAAPNGDLYATWSEYRDAPDPATDEDQLQADVVFTKSTDGGVTWSTPSVVNQDKSNADQFQPYIAVTPQGEIEINYFDRRNDTRRTSGGQVTHSGNFYVDEYLSRSTDGGATWRDIRLSHDMSDPEHSDPLDSQSTGFFGDYQGLVADDCFTIPFMQDSHLSQDSTRDPEFDTGVLHSDFQEVFAWRVPNAKQGNCPTPGPKVAPGELPEVSLTAPRLASDVSTSNRFNLRINAAAANIDFYQLQYRRPSSKGWRNLSRQLLTADYSFRGAYSATYLFRARAIDLAGRAGPWSGEKVTVVPHDDQRSKGRPRYSRGWKRIAAKSAYVDGKLSRTSRRRASLRMNFRGTRVYLVGRQTRFGGRALVRINGRRAGIVNFYSSKTRDRRVLLARTTPARRTNTVEVIALGQKGSRKSKGTRVEVDAVGYRGQ
ncbi:MAG TPA: sialidase family protein [Thermoleophilaceae bacterium]